MTPIPKHLFFIWLGNNIPTYVNFSINAFKSVNPDYAITFIHYSLNEIEQIYLGHIKTELDKLLKDSINSIINKDCKYKQFLYRQIVDGQKIFYGKDIRAIQLLSDIFRLEVINKFGGIYLDCDMFPIKHFDDELLNKEYFIVNKHHNMNTKTIIIRDNYFFGSCGIKKITHNNETFAYSLLQTKDHWWSDINFLINKKKFFGQTLKIGDKSLNTSFYVEHYCDGNWRPINGNIRTPICFLDKILTNE